MNTEELINVIKLALNPAITVPDEILDRPVPAEVRVRIWEHIRNHAQPARQPNKTSQIQTEQTYGSQH